MDIHAGRAFLVGTEQPGDRRGVAVEESLEELASLVDSLDIEVVGQISQRLTTPNPQTFIGSGKLEEVDYWLEEVMADVVIFDDELSPRHQRELERHFESRARVLDRTALILEIFARHARSREGALQVSLAQYEYRLPRLTRLWTHLARQASGAGAGKGAGGIGLKGPGETQLETDRRQIRRQIRRLRRDLDRVVVHRHQQRTRRELAGIPNVALVGYTNAGKSTLLNALTGSQVYVADKPFATLDPVTRRTSLANHQEILVTDTVGLIRKLPHQLILAFRASLEEVSFADVLVHVVDASHPYAVEQTRIAEDLLLSLKRQSTAPVILTCNKLDLLGSRESSSYRELRSQYPDAIGISAATGQGVDELRERIQVTVGLHSRRIVIRVPYDQYHVTARFFELASNVSQSPYDQGVELSGDIGANAIAGFQPFLVRIGK